MIIFSSQKPTGLTVFDLRPDGSIKKTIALGCAPFWDTSWWGLTKTEKHLYVGTNKSNIAPFWRAEIDTLREALESANDGENLGFIGNIFGTDLNCVEENAKNLIYSHDKIFKPCVPCENSPRFHDVHQARYSRALGKIIMACASDDCLATFDPETFKTEILFDFKEFGRFINRKIPSGKTSYFHINSIFLDPFPYNGEKEDLYVNFHNHGETESEIIVLKGLSRERIEAGSVSWKDFEMFSKNGFCTHDILIDSSRRLLTCNSLNSSLTIFNLKGDLLREAILPENFFTRGLLEACDFLIVGASPKVYNRSERFETATSENNLNFFCVSRDLSKLISKNSANLNIPFTGQVYDVIEI